MQNTFHSAFRRPQYEIMKLAREWMTGPGDRGSASSTGLPGRRTECNVQYVWVHQDHCYRVNSKHYVNSFDVALTSETSRDFVFCQSINLLPAQHLFSGRLTFLVGSFLRIFWRVSPLELSLFFYRSNFKVTPRYDVGCSQVPTRYEQNLFFLVTVKVMCGK